MSVKLIRRTSEGTKAGSFYVPSALAQRIPVDARFVAELVDEGVLFRYIGRGVAGDAPSDLPAWIRDGAA